jgi:hypothetical protein
MIDEAAIKREARLSAIEFMIGELCSAFYRDLPATAIHARHARRLPCAARRGSIRLYRICILPRRKPHSAS